MFSDIAYNAKPAPVHAGDVYGEGASTVLLTSAGYDAWRKMSTATPAAAKLDMRPVPSTWIATSGAGVLLLLGLALWLDKRQ